MVMEYLEGHDLDAELQKSGPLPPHVAVDFILQASEALAEAHSLSMVHRDVKLKNLFLTTAVDGRPLVKVLDFGLAKTIGSHGDVSLTAVNSVFGSPQYMSPEQMRSAKDVDFRSDIWSLGVCLYELLTGRVPFDAQGVAEICAMVLKDPVPPPTQFMPSIPRDLEAVIMTCLNKDPARRYQSIADVAYALRGYAADEGSARRILTVMQQRAGQKAAYPTMVSPEAPPVDASGKTLNAWDSGGPRNTRSTKQLTKTQVLLVIAVCAVMATIGTVLGVFILLKTRKPIAPAISATPTVSVVESAEPPPPVETALPPAATTSTATVASADPAPADSAKKPGTSHPTTGSKPTTAVPATSAKKAPNAPGHGADYM
jgi:serine/threonine-protein kinase